VATGTISAPAWLGLDELEEQVILMVGHLRAGLIDATSAFLDCDSRAARTLLAEDQMIDDLQEAVEDAVHSRLEQRLSLSVAEAHRLVSILSAASSIERSGDLVQQLAWRTPQGVPRVMSAQARDTIRDMARFVVDLWSRVADRHEGDEVESFVTLGELEACRRRLCDEVTDGALSSRAVVDACQVAQLYERIGQGAVRVMRTLRRSV
jgi:phosphate uptake regulator